MVACEERLSFVTTGAYDIERKREGRCQYGWRRLQRRRLRLRLCSFSCIVYLVDYCRCSFHLLRKKGVLKVITTFNTPFPIIKVWTKKFIT